MIAWKHIIKIRLFSAKTAKIEKIAHSWIWTGIPTYCQQEYKWVQLFEKLFNINIGQTQTQGPAIPLLDVCSVEIQ